MLDLFHVFLYLHILGAIAAFGPGFAAMIVGPMVAKEPQYANFYARTQLAAGRKLVMPVSTSMLITGVAMILVRGWSNLTAGSHWLELGIALYIVAVVISMGVQAPAGRKLVALTSTPPAPGTAPDPQIPATAKKVRNIGMLLTALVVVIVFTMVMNPA